MNWTRPQDARAQVQRLWDRGTLLAAQVTRAHLFPRRLRFKGPTSTELTTHFDDARLWIAQLQHMRHCRVEMREVRHRVLGSNTLPCAIWIDSLDDALCVIGRQHDAAQFQCLADATQRRQPGLLDWLAARPLKALELAAAWPRLLDVIAWVQAHPRPVIYLRQVDLAGIDSKFIEAHRGVLAELLDRTLPASAIDSTATGVSGFNRRYGFKDKPARIRLRLLDSACRLLPGVDGGDITLDADSFHALRPPISRIFITENEVNFLAFPPVADAMVLFGAGYGFESLSQADWLTDCQLYYWGDIDTHGFAILDQLRARFGHVQSLLMDKATLSAHKSMCGSEDAPINHDLSHLSTEERALYDDLRDQRLGHHLRLEQERIGFDHLRAALQVFSDQ